MSLVERVKNALKKKVIAKKAMQIDRFIYFTFTYLDTSLEQIKKYILEKWGSDDKYRIIDSTFQFNLYDLCPPKGGAHFEKLYFFTPKLCKNKCIMFSNYSDGLSSLIHVLTNDLKIKAYSFRISANNIPEALNEFSCIENGETLRTVYAMKDPKWKFYCEGEIQPFEEKEFYERKIIKQRLNKEILISYCVKLGIDIREDSFWKSQQSLFVERISW